MSKYFFKTTENYNPGGLAPFPAAAIREIQTLPPPQTAAIGLMVQFRLVTLLLYPFQLETSGGTCSSKQSHGRLSSPQPPSSFPRH